MTSRLFLERSNRFRGDERDPGSHWHDPKPGRNSGGTCTHVQGSRTCAPRVRERYVTVSNYFFVECVLFWGHSVLFSQFCPLSDKLCPFRHVLCRPEPGQSEGRYWSVLRHEHTTDVRSAQTKQRTCQKHSIFTMYSIVIYWVLTMMFAWF